MPTKIYIVQHKKYKDIISLYKEIEPVIKFYSTKEFNVYECELDKAKKIEISLESSIKYI